MKPIPKTETLERHVDQIGIGPGARKLEQFKLALALRAPPGLYLQENAQDPMVYVKLFDPAGSWTWLVTEWDGDDRAFGLVLGSASDFGYVSLNELAKVKGSLGIGVEIDVWFLPKPLSCALREEKGWG